MTVPLSQQAYHKIRRDIVSLALAPGAVIDESELQAELGMGRTPIREALQRLALEKLVVILPRRGMFVSEIGVTDLGRLFEVRLELECLAARLAAQRGAESHWAHMEAALDRMPPEGEALDNDALIAIDEACHHILYEATDNPFLQDALVTFYALSLRFWYFFLADIGSMPQAVEEHRAILEALRSREPERAASLMEGHIRSFQTEMQAAIVGERL